MATTNVYEIKRWNGGLSDDAFVGIKDSMYDMIGLEVRKHANYVGLQYALKLDTGVLAPTGYFQCGLAVSNGKTLMFSNTGQIYVNIAGTWTLAYTHAAGAPILGCAEYNGYVYYATATKLHRVLLATIASTFTPTNIDWGTFTAGDTSNHPMRATNLYLYIGDGRYVATVQDTVFGATTLTLPSGESVYQITDNGASVRVYTRQGTNDYGATYYWDGVSADVEQTQRLTGKMQNVVTKDGVDYVIMGENPILYYYPYQKQALKRFDEFQDFVHYPNNAIIYNNYILFGHQYGLYSWGAYSKDYPECLNREYDVSTGSGEPTCVVNNNGTLYVAWKDGSTFGIDKLSTTEYVTNGAFFSRAFFGESIWKNKYSVEGYITHNALATGESIVVKLKEDLTGSYTTFATITGPTTEMVTKFKINAKFYFAQLGVYLTAASPYTSTPVVYNVYLKLEESQ